MRINGILKNDEDWKNRLPVGDQVMRKESTPFVGIYPHVIHVKMAYGWYSTVNIYPNVYWQGNR